MESSNKSKYIDLYCGIGGGLDYGGLGLRLEYLPIPWIGAFLGVGYNFAGLGVNVGLSYKILPNKNVTPVITTMYGYNGVIINKNPLPFAEVDKYIYYGFTVGAGAEFDIGKKQSNKLSVLILVPFRKAEFFTHTDEDVLLVAISVGFNWGFY